MARERIIDAQSTGEAEETYNLSLRPQSLDQCIGQKELLGGELSGLFYGGSAKLLGIQALGAIVCLLFVAITMGTVFYVIKKTIGLRVTPEQEFRGLDICEHGNEAYDGFQLFTTR